MPPKLSRGDRRLLFVAGTLFLIMVSVALFISSGQGSKAEVPTTYSTGSGGAKAAYLLLQQSGYTQSRWERPLDELPNSAHQVLILADPEEAPTKQEREGLTKFISDGGRVIATGMVAGIYLPRSASTVDFEGVSWKEARGVTPSAITRAAPVIVLGSQAYWDSTIVASPLYADGEHTRVVKYNYGKGEVIWWAAATPLTNGGIQEMGNLDFFLACLGDAPSEVLWDEYVHGYRASLGASVTHSPVMWIFLQLALLSLAILATFSRRNGPIFALAKKPRLSPLEFVNTLGGLYERANAAAVAVDVSYQRFRYWLTRRLGMASNASVADLRAAIAGRLNFADERLGPALAECESARYNPSLPPAEALRLVQELDDYALKLRLFRVSRKEKEKV